MSALSKWGRCLLNLILMVGLACLWVMLSATPAISIDSMLIL